MKTQMNIGQAKDHLSQLVAASLRGEDVIIAKAGRPVARIVAIDEAVAAERADRAAKIKAWIGSGRGLISPDAGDLFLEPEYTDDELDAFEQSLG